MNTGSQLSEEIYWKLMSKGFCPSYGTTAQRSTTNSIGTQCFDTNLSKPILHNGTNWVDALGTIV